jgi:hypothetical protein
VPGPPRIGVALESVERRTTGWSVAWRIRNGSAAPLTVTEAWHPHGRFRSSRLRRSLRVPARGSASLEVPARIDAAPGDTVENCFLILRVAQGRGRYRVLARSTLRVDEAGTPRPDVRSVDVEPMD